LNILVGDKIIEKKKFYIINIIGVDWRDSPKEDKQKFTKLCEVSNEFFFVFKNLLI
jgi:hypothetical protein